MLYFRQPWQKQEESKTNKKSDTLTTSALSVGISVSSLSDGMFVLHVACEDNKQKVSLKIDYMLLCTLSAKLVRMNMWTVFVSQGDVVLQNEHVIETLTKVAICADKINSININQGRLVAKLSFCKILWIKSGFKI